MSNDRPAGASTSGGDEPLGRREPESDRPRAPGVAPADNLLVRSIVENIPHMIFVKEAEELRFALFNEAGERLLGMPRTELIGRNDYDLFPPAQADFFTAKDREVLAGREVLDVPEEPIDTPHGQRLLHTKKIPLFDDRGRPRYLLGISLDITEQRRAAEELERAKRAAEAANEAKSLFLATMSHEIRTPLNGIIGMCDLLSAATLDSDLREYASTIQVSARHLMALVQDVLDLSRIESGEATLWPTDFEIRALVEGVRQMLRPRAEDAGLSLTCEVADDVPAQLVGDRDRIRQILLNLAGNAIKFTDEGGVHIGVTTADPRADPLTLRFEVRDTGIGIAPEDRARIFDSFTQVDGSASRRHAGAGLGLTISKRLCEFMKGSIGVSGDPGCGSSFWFTLPMARGEPAPPKRASEPPPRATSKASARILVVDDNRINLKVARAMLERLGHRVDLATRGDEALDAIARETYDLVFMDCEMPELDGFETTARLREREPEGRRVPVVALTAHAMAGDEERCLRAGMNAYLTKPVTIDRLRDVLHRWIGDPARVQPS